MSGKNRFKDSEVPPDFELVFHPQGTVELFDVRGSKSRSIWHSDADDDFTDEFDDEFFDSEEDADKIINYLHEQNIVDEDDDVIDIIENDLEDESDDDDGSFIDAEFEVKKS